MMERPTGGFRSPATMSFALVAFHCAYPLRHLMPWRMQERLNAVAAQESLIRALQPNLPRLTLRQIFGFQALWIEEERPLASANHLDPAKVSPEESMNSKPPTLLTKA